MIVSNVKITKDFKEICKILIRSCVIFCFLLVTSADLFGQRLAVIGPGQEAENGKYAIILSEGLRSVGFRVVDDGAALSAFGATEIRTPFNLTSSEAVQIGAAIGCDYFLLIKAETQRRSSFQKSTYYEATAAVFIVSSRTGYLVKWLLLAKQADTPKDAYEQLILATPGYITDVKAMITDAYERELKNSSAPVTTSAKIEELNDADQPDKSLRPPIPYKRIRPDYTPQAYLFSVTATVDAEVDIDADGKILRLDIVRWAGYGLDESVTEAIRSMNWRPAERNGKTLPMRVLLRYNFKKIEKDNDEDSP